FFRPDLSVKPPQKTDDVPAKVTIQTAAKKLHRFYMAALAKLLREKDVAANLKTSSMVVDKLFAVAQEESLRRLLWVAGAFLEALADGSIALDKKSKPILGKLEQQIKRVAAKGEEGLDAEPLTTLLRSMLHQIALAGATGSQAAAVALAFDLQRHIPGGTVGLGGLNAELKKTVSGDIMEELGRVKDAFDIFVRSDRKNPQSLAELADSLTNIAETLSLLQEDALRQTLLEQVAVIRQLVDGECDTGDDTLMGVAGAVLAVESALRDWGNNGPMVKADASEEQVDDSENSPQVIAEHQRVTRQVMKEAKEDLVRVREAINSYLESPRDKSPLKHLPTMLHNISGSLTMLSYKRVAQVLLSTRIFIEQELVGVDGVPDQEKLDALADAVMSVEYYLEAFVQSRVHPGSVLDVAESAVEVLGYPIGSVTESEPVTLSESPDLGGIEVFETASEASEEPQAEPAAAGERAEETLPAEEPAQVVSDEAAPAVAPAQPAAEVDDEILEIFIEEAEEELENIRQAFPAWSSNPSDVESLKNLRRSFHTLKGSGRLVGALEMGEFAWAFENMLNRVLEGTLAHSATVFDLLEQAIELLPELIEQFRSGKAPQGDVAMLQEMAFEIVEPGGLKLEQAAAAESKPAAAGTSGAEEQTAAQEAAPEVAGAEAATPQKAEAEVPQLDPVLLEIYSKEAESHLQALEDYIGEWRAGGSHKVSEPLIRALHTLQGSSRMAGVISVAEVCASLEKYAKTLQAHHRGVDEQGIDALQGCLDYVRSMLAFLVEGKGEMPDSAAAKAMASSVYGAVQHLEQEANAQPEAGLAARDEADLTPDSATLGAAPSAEGGQQSDSATDPAAAATGQAAASFEVAPQGEASAAQQEEPAVAETPATGQVFEEEYDQELLDIFLDEGGEILDASEETLQEWVNNPDDRQLVEALQRQLHTLKGGARMAGITPVGDLSHILESTFEAVVEGRLERSPRMMDLLQLAHDRLVTMLEQVRNHQPVVGGDDLIRQVEVLGKGGAVQAEAQPEAPQTDSAYVSADEVMAAAEAVQQRDRADTEVKVEQESATTGLGAVEAAIAELELSHSNWLRDVDDQTSFDHLINSATSLSINSGESGVEELLLIAVAVEKLLEAIRDGHVPASKKASDMISLAMDRMHLIIKQSRQGGARDNGNFLIGDIEELIRRSIAEEEAIAPDEVEELPADEPRLKLVEEAPKPQQESAQGHSHKRRGARIQHEMVRVRADLLDNLVNFAGEVSIYRSRVEQQIGSFK
ncbi:MAG TPA: Hpt domain-containing protein, partial [Gammaproteobacteria bacterium]